MCWRSRPSAVTTASSTASLNRTGGASLPGWGSERPLGASGGSHRPSAVVIPWRGVAVGCGVAVAGVTLWVGVAVSTGGSDNGTKSVGRGVAVWVGVAVGVSVGLKVGVSVGMGVIVGVKLG